MVNNTTSFLYQWRNEPSICDKEMHDKRELNRKSRTCRGAMSPCSRIV